jgi:hypothetical protein
MADLVVACPSCAKKYRVREGSKPGQFQCTSCGAAVPYGAQAAPAKAVPARGGPGGGGRGGGRRPARGRPGRARGGARGRARGRRGGGRYDDEEGPPPKSNAALYAILIIAGVVVIGGVAALLLTQGGDEPYTPPTDVADEKPATPDPEPAPKPAPKPEPEPEPKPDPKPEPKPDPKPKPKPKPRKPGELAGMSRAGLATMSYEALVKELDFYEGTPEDVKSEINTLLKDLVDYNAGRAQLDAQSKLREIGRHAVPKVVSAFALVGDQGTHEGMVNTIIVQDTLIGIVGNPHNLTELKQFARPDKKTIQKVVKRWFVWWYSSGYQAKEFKLPDEDEEEEE